MIKNCRNKKDEVSNFRKTPLNQSIQQLPYVPLKMSQPGFFKRDQLRSVQISPDFFGWNFWILSGCTRRNFGKILTNKKIFHIGEKSYPLWKKFFVVRPPAGTSKWFFHFFHLEVPAGGSPAKTSRKKNQWYIPEFEVLAVHTTWDLSANVWADSNWNWYGSLGIIVSVNPLNSPKKCMFFTV